MAKFKLSGIWWIVIGAGGVLVIAFIAWALFFNKSDDSITPASNSLNSNSSQSAKTELVPQTTFANGLGGWYEEVWYKAKTSGGEVITGPNGVTFKAVQPNSRSGIMLDINKDVSKYSKVTINAMGVVNAQTLGGTGNNGREAPVAVAASYVDINGVNHNLLGEDPAAAGQMFWRGFYYKAPTGSAKITNGIEVTRNETFTFVFDLMTLNPKPKTLQFISLEGAGWITREGGISNFSVIAE